ncbi:MAG: M81 family metallopeptidase [Granulosicoccus sp.]
MSKPRIAVGGMQHETNTFAPLKTSYKHFTTPSAWPPLTEGGEIFAVLPGRNIPLSGFLKAAVGWELVPLLWAFAEPAGYVVDDAFDRISSSIIHRLKKAGPVDGVYLDLHGAMVTESYEDGEAELLRRIRKVVGPDLPIVVSLDLHGNLSPDFFERASAVSVYRTYPHLDMAATGARAQILMAELLQRQRPFCRAWRQLDYIIPITSQSTMREPGQRLYKQLSELSIKGVSSIDMAMGFPPADICDTGASVFVYGDDQQAVDTAADNVIDALSQAEDEFYNPLVPANKAVKQAMALSIDADKPVVIADPQDNPGAGGMGDSTGLLNALLQAGAQNAALSMLWDAKTAAAAHEAGEGAEIDVLLGCQYPEYSDPAVKIRARVESLSDGIFPFTGPMYKGSHANFGLCACLHLVHDIADIKVIVSTIRSQNADQAMFRAFGIEPCTKSILVVKSAVHFLNDYAAIAEEIIFADALGANPCNLDTLAYTRLRNGVRIGPKGKVFSGSC